jgi:uncharacterized repeat protein (TIGR01451 family)
MKTKRSSNPFAARFAWVLAAFITFNLPALAAGPQQVSDAVMQQIAALEQEKTSRSAAERKLDSQFVFRLKQNRGQAIAAGVTHLKPKVKFEADGRVLVDIDAAVTPKLLTEIQQAGGMVINSFPQFRAVRAQVPLEQLERLAGSSDVKFIKPAAKAITNTGSVDSEGDVTHRADFARNNFAVNGAGVKVGVLSDGIFLLDTAQSTGDLGDVTVLPGQAGPDSGEEGTAMLEIVHDLAPGSQLYFATAFNGEASFAQNILNLRSNGCDIIIDDVYYLDESPFQDGIIARAVNSVTAGGALYFSAAGNNGNLKDGTSCTWEGDFVDSGQPVPAAIRNAGFAGKVHSFGPTNYATLVAGGYYGIIDLFWSDPLGASTNDYDLFMLDNTGTYLEYASTNPQNGTQDPHEQIETVPDGRIVIVKSSGAPRFLHMVASGGRLNFSTGGATRGHDCATNAFCVAAVDALDSFPGAFTGGAANPVETFSSDGPRHVFFNADGSAITPGNFLSTGGAFRQKPDIAAADDVMTSVEYGSFQPFSGTSAAAPHAGAIAALLLSYDHTLTPAQIRTALTNTALDIEGPGFDSNSGAGIVMAEQALETLPLKPVVAAGSATLVNESCPNGVIDPGETVTLALSLTDIGAGATSNLMATLQETGGVTQASAPQSYGVLSAHGGTGTNLFTYVASGVSGGTNIVTLQLQDGALNLGTASFAFRLGARVIPLSESFDSVTVPNLPSGWSTQSSGAAIPWRTSNSGNHLEALAAATPPNYVGTADSGTNNDNSLISPALHIYSAFAQVSFVQFCVLTPGYSGGVLEISTNGGAYQDIIAAGGSFVTNGYSGNIYSGYSNPLGDGRAVWSDEEGVTIVTLPASAAGQNVRLRWRSASAGSYSPGFGWYIDSIQITDYSSCAPMANNVVVDAYATPNPVVLNGNLTYTINVENTGTDTATNVNVTDQLPSSFSLQFVSYSEGVYPGPVVNGGGTISFNIGTLAGGNTATITLSGTTAAAGLITNRVGISRADGGLITSSNALVVTPVILPSISINDVAVMEDNTNAIFNVSLSPMPATNAYVRFATANQSAAAGVNFTSTNGLLAFAPGVTNQTITVRLIDDLIDTTNKTFAVNLSNPTNALIANTKGIGTIINVDPAPLLSVSDATVVKPNSGATTAAFNFSLSHPSGFPVSFQYSTDDGSAIGYSNAIAYFYGTPVPYLDYMPTNSTLTFALGQTNLSVRVLVTSHTTVKPNQVFYMVISSANYAKIVRDKGVGNIITAQPGHLDHFTWDTISSPQSNGLPFAASVRAKDFFEGDASFTGATGLSAFAVTSYRTNNFFDTIDGNDGVGIGSVTYGYSFTPKANLTVTHFRSFGGNKVSLWKEDGTLLVSQSVSNSAFGWVETFLTPPIQLKAGQTYRLGLYVISESEENFRQDMGYDYPDATLGQAYLEFGDTFPDLPEPGFRFPMVDVQYVVGVPTPLPITPTNSANFSNNAWAGAITTQLPATNVALMASDGTGHTGISSTFDAAPTPGYVTHFTWTPIASPEPISNYFSATITAQDYFNNTASNFAGPVAISASAPAIVVRTNTMFGNTTATYNYYYLNDYTVGHSFTPFTNITVTHLRCYFGSKLSIWKNDGTLLASTNFNIGLQGSWQETALSTPLSLSAGQTYVIGAYVPTNPSSAYFFSFNEGMSTNFPDGVINYTYGGDGDAVPTTVYGDQWDLVDIRYTVPVLTNLPVAISPANSGAFNKGIWSTDNFLINSVATNLTLLANDSIGHTGSSNPFDVNYVAGFLDHFSWSAIGDPQTNATPFTATLTALDHFNGLATNFNGLATLTATGSPVNPSLDPASGNFVQGLWTGSVSLIPAASNVVLRVADGMNRSAASNPFDVVDPPLLPPLLKNVYLGSNAFQFSWTAVPGHSYQVQYKTNLLQTNWLDLGGPISATKVNLLLSQPVGPDPQRFFRVELQQGAPPARTTAPLPEPLKPQF